ncbi:unnamed protein product [Protopolystoma xenopodis]|uniref:Endonuclease V n=1 Tax=Protopolystoma xenopodis TaxID=117903 RepID=A0A3S5AJN2_9PLAT|nr:unnamed protein product [Protopolystoma xenopodis]
MLDAYKRHRAGEVVPDSFSSNSLDASNCPQPDIYMLDGNGSLHPRDMGVACHLGVLIDLPTLGVAKNLLIFNDTSMKPQESRKDKQVSRRIPEGKRGLEKNIGELKIDDSEVDYSMKQQSSHITKKTDYVSSLEANSFQDTRKCLKSGELAMEDLSVAIDSREVISEV